MVNTTLEQRYSNLKLKVVERKEDFDAFIKMLDLLLQNIRMAVKAILIVDMKMDPMTVTANQGGNRQDQSKNAKPDHRLTLAPDKKF